jgi:hypothetical protein
MIDVDKQPKATGFQLHPENINKTGRPKRKTLTELIHAKLDDTPEGWEKLVALVLSKMFTDKDKDLIKELWHYTDGMPKQSTDITSDGEKIEGLIIIKDGDKTK